jgi:hypothetical protein
MVHASPKPTDRKRIAAMPAKSKEPKEPEEPEEPEEPKEPEEPEEQKEATETSEISPTALVPLVPQAERTVDFYGDQISVALIGEGEESEVYVPLRTITEFLGLGWGSQFNRLQRDEVLKARIRMVTVHGADGRPRDMVSIPLDLLPGWLFGITTSRVREDLAPKLRRYREECFRILWREYQQELMQRRQIQAQAQVQLVPKAPLAQVREMGLAIAQLAEQQMALEGRVEDIDARVEQVGEQVSIANSRLDRAAEVVSDLKRRLGSIERQVLPASTVTDEQAAEISNKVKALAQFLTTKEPGRNFYQSIFGELYRRFAVSSYKNVRKDQYQNVLKFLDEWLETASGS